MKANRILIVASACLCAGFFAACAATAPTELVNARQAYQRASAGVAAKTAPAELHVASQALAAAEQSFKKDSRSYQTKDLAYVAQRKAELAEATASIIIEQKSQAAAQRDYQKVQGNIAAEAKQDLSDAQIALAQSQKDSEMAAQRFASEQAARIAADQRTAEAQAALAKLAAVKEESRGVVITLSGSVLFATNQATLLPAAVSRLDQVAEVLLTTRDRNLVVEGHADSRGAESYNMALSQRRADSVRNHLIRRGYPADRIRAHGIGEGQPVADNASAEGRANNRRVEIIIERESYASNQ
ncbi:MAG: OmpA family protein [Desulfatibacillaceae bacterium]|nr:OmpA family protein [Desulfatibacillaceae bacterium]